MARAEAERRRLIDAEKIRLAAESASSEAPVVDPVPAEAKRRNAASKAQPKGKAKVAKAPVVEAPAEPVVETPATAQAATPAPAREKKPYNPEKLSGAAEAGKAPKKGQLPAGLLAYLARKHAGSQVIAAAAQPQAQKPAEKARTGRKGSKR